MGMQTALVQLLLCANMAVLALLLQPFSQECREAAVKLYVRCFRQPAFYHTAYALYCIILLIFIDAAARMCLASPMLYRCQCELRFYMSGFTLAAALLLDRVCGTLLQTARTEEMNQQCLKQHNNSMSFVMKVIADLDSERQKTQQLHTEIGKLEEAAAAKKDLASEIQAIKQAYLSLSDKYEKLKESKFKELKKNK